MSRIIVSRFDFSAATVGDYPTTGKYLIALDTADGKLKMMDSLGNVTLIESGDIVISGEGIGNTQLLVDGVDQIEVPLDTIITYESTIHCYNLTEDTLLTFKHQITVKNVAGVITVLSSSSTQIGVWDANLLANFFDNTVPNAPNLEFIFSTTGSTPSNNIRYSGILKVAAKVSIVP